MHCPTPPSEKNTSQLHPWNKLPPPANTVMQVLMVSGNVAIPPSLMCISRTPSLVPIRTKITRRYWRRRRNQYLCLCLEMWKDFTPLVYSVDGIVGRETKNREKRLVYHLSEKWHKPLPQMGYYVQIRMFIAMVSANSLLIHGSRDWQCPPRPFIFNQHAMNDW
jgi:hypothetical protein